MKLMICGSTGYIGRRLVAAAAPRFDVVAASGSGRDGSLPLDLTRPDDFDRARLDACDVVLLAAAISSPDICANDRPRAWAVNVTGASRLTELALQRGAKVIFFSSDTVYGHRDEPFDESAPCNPAGEYARMKHEVEQRFAGEPGFKSLRLSYVFSRDDKFTGYLCGCAAAGRQAEIFDPFVRAIVHREDVVDAALGLAARWSDHPAPVINVGGPQALTRSDYAQTLREQVWPDLRFSVVTPDEGFFTNRPRRIPMRSPWLERLLGRPARTLVEAARFEFIPTSEK